MSVSAIISAFLLTLCALPFVQGNAKQESINRGKEIYAQLCVVCHQADGKGLAGAFPPLAGSDYLLETPDKAIHAVKYGLQGEIVVNGKTYNSIMTNQNLSDEEVADVMNYVMNTWGNSHEMITVERVKKVEK
jgi:mono/diheme cytochrome c family protein